MKDTYMLNQQLEHEVEMSRLQSEIFKLEEQIIELEKVTASLR